MAQLAALQQLAALVRTEVALSALGKREERVYKVWWFADDRDHLFSGRTLEETIAAALASVAAPKTRSRQSAA